MVNLTRSLAISYIRHGIRSNSVCPSFVDTPQMAEAMAVFLDPRASVAVTPMKRPARPNEIPVPIAFLSSDEASYVNGATLVVDGTSAGAFPGSLTET